MQALRRRRDNLGSLVTRLEQLDDVAAAQTALELLVPAADYGGALDVMEDLQAVLAGDEIQGLHAFRCVLMLSALKCSGICCSCNGAVKWGVGVGVRVV